MLGAAAAVSHWEATTALLPSGHRVQKLWEKELRRGGKAACRSLTFLDDSEFMSGRSAASTTSLTAST